MLKVIFTGLYLLLFIYVEAQKLPDFKLVSMTGDTLSTELLKGKVVYINVFETYCAPCIAEIPDLNKLKEKHPNTLFVALTPAKQSKVKRLLEKHQINFIVIPEATELCSQLNVRGYPTHFYIDKYGIIHESNSSFTFKFDHAPTKDELRKRLQEVNYNRLDSLMSKYENE